MTSKELEDLKKKIEEQKNAKIVAETMLNQYNEKLLDEFKCSSIKEAKILIKKLEDDCNDLENDINAETEILNELLEN